MIKTVDENNKRTIDEYNKNCQWNDKRIFGKNNCQNNNIMIYWECVLKTKNLEVIFLYYKLPCFIGSSFYFICCHI